MRWTRLLLLAPLSLGLASAAAPARAQTEHGAFVVRLGKDTVAVDQYARSPRMLDGALILRSPVTRVVSYKALLRDDGTIRRLESSWWTPSPEVGPPQPADAVVEFYGDSARIEYLRGAETKTFTFEVARGTVPLLSSVYSIVLYDQGLRQGFAAEGRTFEVHWLAVDRRRVSSSAVSPRGQDSVAVPYFAGTLVTRVSEDGAIQGLTGSESTAKISAELVASVDIEALAADFGQRDKEGRGLGIMSPRDTMMTTVAGATLEVDYSRPSKRGRTVWGGVVPWDQVWRTGANRATHFRTDRDLVIGGVQVPVGRYTLFTLPGAEETLLIISKQTDQWGTGYDPARDLGRIPLQELELDEEVEQFTIAVESRGSGGGVLALKWGSTGYWASFEVGQ